MDISGFSQADILAALQAQGSSRKRSPPTTLPHSELATDAPASLTKVATGTTEAKPTNSRKLYCPREGCGSVVIGAGAAEWIEAEAGIIPHDPSSPLDAPTSRGYWHIPGSPFAFDNIGFLRPDGSRTIALPPTAPGTEEANGARVKWLICADCDLGPIGWSFEGGDRAWVAADRVRYGEVVAK